MFKKALAHQSNATPLRSSARRGLVSGVMSAFPALGESLANNGNDNESASSGLGPSPEKELGRALIPEGVRSANFETSGGVEGTFYLSPDGDVLWMTFGRGSKDMVPTLAVLAGPVPPFLPTLQIHHPLPPPLFTGAPLFLPAVRHMGRPHLLPDVGEGELVALVADTEGDGRVSYVGVARVVANGGLREALGRLLRHRAEGVERDEGKFADILCIIDDHLWEMGTKPQLNTFPLPAPRKPLVAPPVSQTATPSVEEVADGVAAMSVEDSSASAETPAVPEGTPLAASEVSTLLSASLLQALSTNPPSFPIPSSQLYSAHVLPSRPAYIPLARRDDVVINRSEWKKLAKWMKELSKDGVLKIKESKGEAVVTGFDAKHLLVQGHRPYLTISEDDAKSARKTARETAAAEPGTAASKSGGREMAIEELWKPLGNAAPFWEACGIDKDNLNSPSLLKPTLDAYLTKHKLVERDYRTVRVDALIAAAVRASQGDTMHRDEVLRRLRNNVGWSVSIKGVVKKGVLNPITMAVKTRQGRKQVTLVAGLEGFGIDTDDFADELRRLCAGSASVQPLSGASPKLNLKEVLVQGSQCKLVTEALVARGVPKKYIKEGEGDKKRK